jgi:hypothetical protein
MKENLTTLTTYRVTIDIRSLDTRNSLKEWLYEKIQENLIAREEILEMYVDEMR